MAPNGPLLILGAQGQVGWELQRALQSLGPVLAWDRAELDLADPAAVEAALARVQPGAVVNAAAHTAVDRAETEPELAAALNTQAPGVLARWAAQAGVPLVHYSTDYVFDGTGTHARTETEATAPLSVYGRTKRDGEDAIRAAQGPHLILRTSWVYAARGANFAKTMLRLGAERELLRVVDDQIGAPTGAELLADATAHALRQLQHNPAVAGTYHLCAAGHTSWADYARFVFDTARSLGTELRVQQVEGLATRDYPTPAQRPLNSRLDCRHFETTFGLHLPDWQLGVRRMLQEILTP